MSSNRPYPAESWPDDRVAANPPRLANSKLCGKCPSEKPVLAKQLLGPWPGDAGTELGLAGYLVESQQLIEAP